MVHHVSFSLERGCLMGILGANGSGKTTLVKALCGILPHEGTCLLENTELETLTPKQIAKLVSYIPQRSGISIDISALDVVLMGFNPKLKLLEHPTKAMTEAALEALDWVGLGGKEDKNYLHLSEGQKQLCIMARTIVSGSKLLLLDEPESALDFRHRYRMLDMIRSWINSTQGGAVVTLHDPMLALNYCDNLMLLKNGELLDILSPKEDSLEKMGQALSRIYGPVSLQVCRSRSGREILTMLKEDEQ
ncbi:MAG: ABC transporter ATP-binding protein [Oscillospiraceae bacterium]|nr:ABC transporter ATP-binding protein [Oscillospiraceae bacterium]